VTNISIGILAHDEAEVIEETLTSLFNQSLFTLGSGIRQLELIIVANGCTDETVKISDKAISRLAESCPRNIDWSIHDIPEPGKSNAWNLFVHHLSNVDADYLILMDADINFLETDTLTNMVSLLKHDSKISVSTDVFLKDLSFKKNKTIIDRFSLLASKSAQEHYQNSICGQLYCARADVLRAIWMPKGLLVEDGYLRAMIATDRFTSEAYPNRVQTAPSASHSFKAYNSFVPLILHEKRIVIGTVINQLLFKYFWSVCHTDMDAGTLVLKNNEADSLWLQNLVDNNLEKNGSWWVIPQKLTFRRFLRMKNYSPGKFILLFPFVLAAFCLDLLVFLMANRTLKNRKYADFW
jgi:glycosyltransferase involved in cell wall biosynthesis